MWISNRLAAILDILHLTKSTSSVIKFVKLSLTVNRSCPTIPWWSSCVVAETFFGDFGEFLWSDKNPKIIKWLKWVTARITILLFTQINSAQIWYQIIGMHLMNISSNVSYLKGVYTPPKMAKKIFLFSIPSYSGEKMASNELKAAEIKLLQDIALNFVYKCFTETPWFLCLQVQKDQSGSKTCPAIFRQPISK